MERLSVVHLCDYFHPAYRYQEYYLIREQIAKGYKVDVITSERHFPFTNYESTAKSVYGERPIGTGIFNEAGYTIHRLPVQLEFFSRVLLKGLKEKLEELNPDVVICHNIVGFKAITLANSNIRSKMIFDDHMIPDQIRKDFKGKALYTLFRMTIASLIAKKAYKIVAVSDPIVDIINNIYGIKRKVEVIPLGADTRTFYQSDELREQKRKELGFNESDIVITVTGKMIAERMPHHLVKAMNKIDTDRKVQLLFVGNISDIFRNEFMESIKSSKFPYKLFPEVKHDELNRFYNASDIIFHPQPTISSFEAMACACPLITHKVLKERYSGGNGLGINPNDIDDIAKALKQMIHNDSERIRMGKRSKEIIEKELNWTVLSERYLS